MLACSVFDASGDGRDDDEAQGLEEFHLWWFHFFVWNDVILKTHLLRFAKKHVKREGNIDEGRRPWRRHAFSRLQLHRYEVDPIARIVRSIPVNDVFTKYLLEKFDEVLVDVRAAPRATYGAIQLVHESTTEDFVNGCVGRLATEVGE